MKDIHFTIKSNTPIASNIFQMELAADEQLPPIKCGQFLNLEVAGRRDLILRRPFCICKFGKNSMTIVYAVVGEGTSALSRLKRDTEIKAVLPLGRGFALTDSHKKVVLLGGGLGVAPLLPVPKCYPAPEFRAYLGFSNKSTVILEDDFRKACGTVTVTTDDGSYGVQGYPTQALQRDIEAGYKPDVILTCGSHNMLKAVAKFALGHKIPAYASTEARMGCGVGACLVCVCKVDGRYVRVCANGPVFKLEELF